MHELCHAGMPCGIIARHHEVLLRNAELRGEMDSGLSVWTWCSTLAEVVIREIMNLLASTQAKRVCSDLFCLLIFRTLRYSWRQQASPGTWRSTTELSQSSFEINNRANLVQIALLFIIQLMNNDSNRNQPIDWFRNLGWLQNTSAFYQADCTRNFWTALSLIPRTFQGPKRKDNKNIVVTNISISMENRESKSVYRKSI